VGYYKDEKQISKINHKENKRIARLLSVVGIDLCACGPSHSMKCDGKCRQAHCDGTNQVKCFECYRIDPYTVKPNKSDKPKRKWQDGKEQVSSRKIYKGKKEIRERKNSD